MADRQEFFIQDSPKEAWHVESEDNCEIMLCGKFISVEKHGVRISASWGVLTCADCWMALERKQRTVFR